MRADLTDSDIHDLWRVADRLADRARLETLAHFRRRDLGVESKAVAFDPVTEADRACEAAMRDILTEMRPDDGILGEEEGPRASKSGLTWVLDPIDGTRSFMSGTPTWGVLIALRDEEGAFMGIVDQPYIRERFWGGPGRAEVEGPSGRADLKVRACATLGEATLFTTFPEVGTSAEGAAFARVARQVRLTRYGCDCYAYALLAAGQIDLVIEAGLKAFDIAAPLAVIEAAGGIVTDWQGGSAQEGGQVIAAGDPRIHAAALEILNA